MAAAGRFNELNGLESGTFTENWADFIMKLKELKFTSPSEPLMSFAMEALFSSALLSGGVLIKETSYTLDVQTGSGRLVKLARKSIVETWLSETKFKKDSEVRQRKISCHLSRITCLRFGSKVNYSPKAYFLKSAQDMYAKCFWTKRGEKQFSLRHIQNLANDPEIVLIPSSAEGLIKGKKYIIDTRVKNTFQSSVIESVIKK